jgi:hypothetical protein
MIKRSLGITLGLILCASAAQASPFLGTSVTGVLNFGGGVTNYFNSSNGFVPAGCQNSGLGSATVTIVDPTVEFCFADGANTDSAQFTDTTITLTDLSVGGGTFWTMTFTDVAFGTAGLEEVSDNFPNGGVTLTRFGNQLIFSQPAFGVGGNFSATYRVNGTIPEPMTLTLFGSGLAALAARRRKKSAKA